MPDLSILVREGALAVLLLGAMVIDIRSMRIPNRLTFGGAGLALLLALWPDSHPGILDALAGLALGLIALLPLRIAGVLGAGDVKLMAMVGAFVGVPEIFGALVFSMIAGGVAAIGFALFRRKSLQMLRNVQETLTTSMVTIAAGHAPLLASMPSIGKLPYAIGICAGCIAWIVYRHLN